ncbi:MAG TPA: integrase core domain-containing protein [Anaeromyxobacteraceae bacterium]|nr:integrase core domain-containing protein [Anaeromyxobacteraceae bacterium]
MTPDTILRWYRELIARNYDGAARRGRGRPKTALVIQGLVVRIARENPSWGYTRIRGALRNLRHEIGRNTIKRILFEHGLEPAPSRGKGMAWETFIKAHLGVIAAADLFTVEVLTLTGLFRYFVLFVIDIQTRRVEIAGIVRQPYGAWMNRIARNLTDPVDGFLQGTRYLLTADFVEILGVAGVKCVKLPARSPDLSAYAERFALSIKSECLDKLVPLGERHLRLAISEYVAHYHLERNHQGLNNQLITTPALSGMPADDHAPVVRHERLGGRLSFYHRRAA